MWKRQNSDSKKPLTLEEAKYKAAAYCSLAEHCPQEVKDKLYNWGCPAAEIEAVIDYLMDENFINEERYCQAFVGDKIRYQGWGRDKVRRELAMKHLPANLIREAIALFPEEEYFAILQRIADKKKESLHGETDPRKAKDKLVRFLIGRGFTFSDMHHIHEEVNEEDYNYEE